VCLRGASAVEKILAAQPDAKVRVFAVWEPILPTDFSAPATFTLRRLSDRRVTQFWDKRHVLAQAMAESRDRGAKPGCYISRGILWDLIAVYPAGAVWNKTLPEATLFDGPVVRAVARAKIL
jgi:hypothetical protein